MNVQVTWTRLSYESCQNELLSLTGVNCCAHYLRCGLCFSSDVAFSEHNCHSQHMLKHQLPGIQVNRWRARNRVTQFVSNTISRKYIFDLRRNVSNSMIHFIKILSLRKLQRGRSYEAWKFRWWYRCSHTTWNKLFVSLNAQSSRMQIISNLLW